MALTVQHPNIDRFDEILNPLTIQDDENTFRIKPELGEGSFNRFGGNNWELYTGQFRFKEDIRLQREPDLTVSGRYSFSFRTFKGELNDIKTRPNEIPKAGEGILFNSNESRVNNLWHRNTECSMVFLIFNKEWVKQLESSLLLPDFISAKLEETTNPMFHVELTPDMRHNLRQMLHTPSEIQGAFLKTYLYNKCIELVNQAASLVVNRINYQVRNLAIHPDDLNTLEQVKVQIINNYQDAPSLNDLVQLSGMSKSKLQRLFQKVYKTSVYQFIKNIRMEKAMELLMQGHSVTEAGYDVGYSSIPNFSATFKEHYKQSPKSISGR